MLMDDLKLGEKENISVWSKYHKIIMTFGDAFTLYMNESKSKLIHNDHDDTVVKEIFGLFRVIYNHVAEGITYLGFTLKPMGYINKDWEWLVVKINQKLDHWKHKCMSMGGRLIMLKSVMQNLSIYSMHPFWFPCEIIKRIKLIMGCFIWPRAHDREMRGKIHLR